MRRVAGLWSGVAGAAPAFAFRSLPTHPASTTDCAEAVARAHQVYSEGSPRNDPTLEWLETLSQSGRQLYLAHAMRRLDGLNGQNRKSLGLAQEAAILARLAAAAGPCSQLLERPATEPLETAFQRQLARLRACRATGLQEALARALALLQASRALTKPATLEHEAGDMLAAILPQLVAADGSPLGLSLHSYAAGMGQIYDAAILFAQPQVQESLDRARPFLAMFLGADGQYCFDATRTAPKAVGSTAPLSCAPLFGSVRLEAEKAVLIAGPAGDGACLALDFSSAGQRLLHVEVEEPAPMLPIHASRQSTDVGDGLEITADATQCTAFLARQGNDLRTEFRMKESHAPNALRFVFAPGTRVSLARSGVQATLSTATRQTWQLTLRGATLQPRQEPHILVATPTAESRAGAAHRINWALKRLARPSARTTGSDTPELPF